MINLFKTFQFSSFINYSINRWSVLLAITSFDERVLLVMGEVLWFFSQISIASYSYVLPSSIITGLMKIS